MLHLHFLKLYIALLFQRILHQARKICILEPRTINLMMHSKMRFASWISTFKLFSALLKNPHPEIA